MVIYSRHQMEIPTGCDPPLPVSTFICRSTSSTWGKISCPPAGGEALVRRRFLGGSRPTVLISTVRKHLGKPTFLCHVLDPQSYIELGPQVLSPKFNYLWRSYLKGETNVKFKYAISCRRKVSLSCGTAQSS